MPRIGHLLYQDLRAKRSKSGIFEPIPRLSSVYGLRPVHRVLGLHLVYIARVASIQFQLAAPMVGRNRSGDLLRHFLVAGSVRRVHRVTCLHQVYIGSI